MMSDTDRGARLRMLGLSFTTAVASALALSACGGGGSSGAPPPPPAPAPTYTIAGTISAPSTAGLVLSNGSTTLAVPVGSTTFSFPGTVPAGTTYNVTIGAQPTARDQSCAIAAGGGTIAGADASVAVTCHAVVWTATDLEGGVPYVAPYVDGPVAVATFRETSGLAIDSAGNIYISDALVHVIRKLTPQGVVSTFAGNGLQAHVDGNGTAASFFDPQGMVFDAAGNLFVADSLSIRKVTPDGTVSTLAGSALITDAGRGFSDGVGSAALFNDADDIKIDSTGNFYVADGVNYAIRKVTPDGTVTTLAGAGTTGLQDGTGSAAMFQFITALAIDASNNLIVADETAVRKVTPAGVVTTLAGGPIDTETCTLSDGTTPTVSPQGFCRIGGVAVDPEGNVYVSDFQARSVVKLSAGGVITTIYGGFPTFPLTNSLLFDASGNLIVDTNGIGDPRVMRLTPN